MALRKNITISEEDYDAINSYCRKVGKTFSEFLRDSALEVVRREEETELLEYLIRNVSFVSEEEQEEFEKMELDLEERGRELHVDDIL